ncbi:MAG: hypothetical protein DMF90_26410 [Acidobacteria bacterium]|nr:MAG: hypothetical protein DMF90_26410 [Acidobacteriota bacterium]
MQQEERSQERLESLRDEPHPVDPDADPEASLLRRAIDGSQDRGRARASDVVGARDRRSDRTAIQGRRRWRPRAGSVLWEEHSQDQRSIASITKVMTALVFLESDPDLSEMITVTRPDVSHASTTHLRSNDRLEAGDLLHLLLISSDNAAARVLARVSPYGSTGFIQRMNEKAAELGLQSTRYADPSGLLSDNVSSAYDMARLIAYVSVNDRIGSIMRTQEYTAYTARRPIAIHSTNHLLGRDDVEVRGGKTGFINSSGYCLATLLRLPESGQQVAVVVLGARSNAGRFLETQNLFNWFMSKAPAIFSTRTTLAAQEQ